MRLPESHFVGVTPIYFHSYAVIFSRPNTFNGTRVTLTVVILDLHPKRYKAMDLNP